MNKRRARILWNQSVGTWISSLRGTELNLSVLGGAALSRDIPTLISSEADDAEVAKFLRWWADILESTIVVDDDGQWHQLGGTNQ